MESERKDGTIMPYVHIAATVLLTLLAWTVPGHAAEMSIAMEKDQWQTGERIAFTIVAIAPEQPAAGPRLPESLTCVLLAGEARRVVTAERTPDHEPPSAGRTRDGADSARYAYDAPGGVEGSVTMRIPELAVPAIVFAVVSPDAPAPANDGYPTMETLFTLYQPYLGNIAAYEPMYFLVGVEPENTKFQISFKYRFFNQDTDLARSHPWIKGFNFGYTQTSFWDLESQSAPFEDTSYKPELFWISDNFMSRASPVKGLFIETGIQHESNGLGGRIPEARTPCFFAPFSSSSTNRATWESRSPLESGSMSPMTMKRIRT
jgi:phospholipase A1